LPNGGAIDLENMQTYTMEDFASDIQQVTKLLKKRFSLSLTVLPNKLERLF
jgi:hypothetical protein